MKLIFTSIVLLLVMGLFAVPAMADCDEDGKKIKIAETTDQLPPSNG